MIRKIGLPILAMLAMLAFVHPTPASAGVHFGVGVYAAPPVYSYPAYPYPGYYGAPAGPYVDSYYYNCGYAYPSIGFCYYGVGR